ncbi:PAQR family membrane homeostasis protein TrhA [Janthinobacterium sp. B9-8]|uniref:PAQR family membrane homeostasis protein TrhA n=1 Tax=Janthinobacterium sp. B9-8 TaxID=1236179 RepID=UPI00061D2BDD|nr:hemolysin III family protein [Janthinobacterium sp. B9-8]AMC36504.1 hemolysin III [Janthinobacterium sp. B9-8]
MYHGERFNSWSHLIGAALAISGLILLITFAGMTGDPWKIVSVAVYGSTLVLLYVISTLYHSLSGKAKAVFQRLDHCAIYLLIAGSYTPFALVTLHGPLGWTIFGVNWGLAIFGIVQENILGKRTRILSLGIYVVMGWLIIFAIKPLMAALPAAGMAWLAAGGVVYTVGIVFYVLDTRIPHGHGIWHLFVLGGSLCQFISILFYVI